MLSEKNSTSSRDMGERGFGEVHACLSVCRSSSRSVCSGGILSLKFVLYVYFCNLGPFVWVSL